MTYDGEIRLKAVVDKSGIVDLEADLGEVEKKAGDAEKAVQDIKLDDSTEKSAKRAAGGVQDLARETRKATEETQRLNQAMQDTERHRNTKIHMNNGQVFDWGGNLVEDASRNTDEMEAAQERLSAAAKQTEQAMRSMAEETQKVNEASQGLGDNAADGIEQQLTPTRNMIAFIKKSFQDIPEMFGMLKEKVSSVLQQSGAGLGEADMTSFQKTEKDWDNLSEKAAHYKGILEELDRKGKGFGDADYDEAYVQWQRAEQAIKDYKAQLINTGQKQLDLKRGIQQVGEESKKTYRKMNQGTKKTSSLFSSMASRLKGIMLSLLIFNWISKAFNAMIAGMKTGFTNLMGYSNEYANTVQSLKNAMSTLGNSFAAAFAPIVSMVIPWLTQLINAIAKAISYIGQFFAILGGKNTFVRAKQIQDSYNSSLNKTGSAAKKAAGALAKFDDLDVLQKQDSSGGGASGTQPKDMFEEVPVDSKVVDWLDGIKEKLSPILEYLEKMRDAFADGFFKALGDPTDRLETIRKGLEQIKTAMIDIWTDPDVLGAADRWVMSLVEMLGSFAGMLASVGLSLAAFFIGGFGQYLENDTDKIKQWLIRMFDIGTEINQLLENLFVGIAKVFEALASENGIRMSTAMFGSFFSAMGGMSELAAKIGRDLLEVIVQPFTDNAGIFEHAFEGLFGNTATYLEGLKQALDDCFAYINRMYDEYVKPFVDSFANGISSIITNLMNAWYQYIQPTIDRIAEKMSSLMNDHFVPLVAVLSSVIGHITSLLQSAWETIIQPILDWIINYVGILLVEVFNLLVDILLQGVQLIIDGFTNFMMFLDTFVLRPWAEGWENAKEIFAFFWQSINELSEFLRKALEHVFKLIRKLIDGDWKGAWDTAVDIFDKAKKTIEDKLNALRDFVAGIFNSIKEKLSELWDSIGGFSGIGNAISGMLGGGSKGGGSASTMAMSMDDASAALNSVPALASGSVIRGGNPFLAVLGDQPSGQTNVEAPLSTIEQALENVMNRGGYGGLNPTISLNVDGQEFARLTLQDILQEASRQGYNVEVLGVV